MRFRTLALAVALGCGFGMLAEARQKPPVHQVSTRRKVKKAKRHKTPKRPKVKHVRHAA